MGCHRIGAFASNTKGFYFEGIANPRAVTLAFATASFGRYQYCGIYCRGTDLIHSRTRTPGFATNTRFTLIRTRDPRIIPALHIPVYAPGAFRATCPGDA